MQQEAWLPIPGFNGRYEVSSWGRVRSYANGRWGNTDWFRILEPKKSTAGYPMVSLYYAHNGGKASYKMVHRLVAEVFLPNPDGLPVVNHIDGNKTNNVVWNLEWVTSSENSSHAVRIGLSKASQKQKDSVVARCSIPVAMLDMEGNEVARFPSAKVASSITGACHSSIIKCCRGRLNKTNGYQWIYVNDRKDVSA